MKNKKLQNEELHRISPEAFKKASKMPVILLLDNVRSLNNVGSVFRTSDAFRIEKSTYAVSPPLRPTGKSIKRPWGPKTAWPGNTAKKPSPWSTP